MPLLSCSVQPELWVLSKSQIDFYESYSIELCPHKKKTKKQTNKTSTQATKKQLHKNVNMKHNERGYLTYRRKIILESEWYGTEIIQSVSLKIKKGLSKTAPGFYFLETSLIGSVWKFAWVCKFKKGCAWFAVSTMTIKHVASEAASFFFVFFFITLCRFWRYDVSELPDHIFWCYNSGT